MHCSATYADAITATTQQTHAFVASPEMVVATTLAGRITFDPEHDTIPLPGGKQFKFTAPYGKELPPKGFDPGEDTFQARMRN
jgi:aconitate hydratase